jgi:hypothetical protein
LNLEISLDMGLNLDSFKKSEYLFTIIYYI